MVNPDGMQLAKMEADAREMDEANKRLPEAKGPAYVLLQEQAAKLRSAIESKSPDAQRLAKEFQKSIQLYKEQSQDGTAADDIISILTQHGLQNLIKREQQPDQPKQQLPYDPDRITPEMIEEMRRQAAQQAESDNQPQELYTEDGNIDYAGIYNRNFLNAFVMDRNDPDFRPDPDNSGGYRRTTEEVQASLNDILKTVGPETRGQAYNELDVIIQRKELTTDQVDRVLAQLQEGNVLSNVDAAVLKVRALHENDGVTPEDALKQIKAESGLNSQEMLQLQGVVDEIYTLY